MKFSKILLAILMLWFCAYPAAIIYHKDNRTSNVHTPFRWIFADSAARVGASCVAADTQKLALQENNFTIWELDDATPTWKQVGGRKYDTLWVRYIKGNSTISADAITAESLNVNGTVILGTLAVDPNVMGSYTIAIPYGNKIISGTSVSANFNAEIVPFTGGGNMEFRNRYNAGNIDFYVDSSTNAMRILYNGWTQCKLHNTALTRSDSGLTTNGEDTLKYNDTTFYDSLFDGSTYRARGLARIVQIGAHITMYQPTLSGTITASTPTYIKGLPAKYKPSAYNFYPIINVHANGSSWLIGMLRINSSGIIVQKDGTYLDAGTGGVHECSLTWIKE